MGQGQSNSSYLSVLPKSNLTDEENNVVVSDLQKLCGAKSQNEVSGGSDGYAGAYEALQSYGDSVYSKAKEKLIRDIASEVFTVLNVGNAKQAHSAPIHVVVKGLEKIVPNPGKGKGFNDSFNKSSGKQKAVCDALANAINKHYGGHIIPADAKEHEKCNKVVEVMRSLFTGLHTEFMSVAGDVLRIIRNLETLNQFVDASYRRQSELVKASADPQLSAQADNVSEVYKSIKAELERQLAVLSNLVNVSVGPAGKSLIGLLEENRDFAGLVQDIKADVGTQAFGDKLGYLLSGVSTVAHSAELVDKALKKIGMSVQEFKSAKNLQELRLKIYDHIQRKSPSSKELDSMMAAAEIIYKNDYNHKAIADLLNKKKGGCDCVGGGDHAEHHAHEDNNPHCKCVDCKNKRHQAKGSDSDSDSSSEAGDAKSDAGSSSDEKHGGNDDDDQTGLPAYWAKKSLATKIKKKAKYRELMLREFRKVLKQHYRNIVNAADNIAKQIGQPNGIPADDNLKKFIEVFGQIDPLDNDSLHIALSGYPKDSVSREQRDVFMNKYHMLDLVLEPLVKGPGGKDFESVKSAANDLVKAIDNFSDKMVKAISEIHIDRPEEIREVLKQTSNKLFGAAEGGSMGFDAAYSATTGGVAGAGGEELFGTGSFVEFRKVQNELNYYYSIANIKTNLSRVADEMKNFGEDYEQILGEEAAYLIDNIKREYLALLDNVSSEKASVASPAQPAVGALEVKVGEVGPLYAEASRVMNDANAKLVCNNLKELYTRQMNAKVKMVEVGQAIDLYLRSFADGIARHPDSIKSVIKMLDQVEIVAKWFTDRSGDNLASLFEFFPCGMNGVEPVYSQNENSVIDANGKVNLVNSGNHHYLWVEKRINDGVQPGNPFLGRVPNSKDCVKGLLTLSEKTVKSMRALENILSAFASVGSKFGDLDPLAKTFMNPAQIFNVLCEYVIVSAFTTDFAPGSDKCIAVKLGSFSEEKLDEASVPSRNPQNFRKSGTNSAAIAHVINNNVAPVPRNVVGVLSGVANVDAVDEKINLSKKLSVAMACIPDDNENPLAYHNPSQRVVHSDLAGWTDRFFDSDLMFMMVVKSIVCKVFTVVDAYRLFHRPVSAANKNMYDSLNPLRTILGGKDKHGGAQHVKVMPEALELYLRLPLLAEWYRDKYVTKKGRSTNNPEGWQLSLVPSVDGIWSEFINLVFDKADYVEEGNYSDAQLNGLINAMNNIYKTFKNKYPKATVRNIINSFVSEINQAFGFIKQEEIDAYMNERRKYLNEYKQGVDEADFVNFDILGSEDQFGRNPAPSDKFLTVGARQKQRKQRSMVHLQEEILRIRQAMDEEFRNFSRNNANSNVSFVDTLRLYKKELDASKSEREQYDVVVKLLQSSNNLAVNSVDKLIMVHEAIVTPLAVLLSVYKVLDQFNSMLHGLSLVNLEKKPADQSYLDYLKSKYSDDAVNNYENCDKFSNIGAPYVNLDDDAKTAIMGEYLRAILELCNNPNKLVNCSVSTSGAINIDYAPLEELCVSLLVQVRKNIDRMRIDFISEKNNILNVYEAKDNVGSVHWLEEKLVEVLLKNRDKCGLPYGLTEHFKVSFDKLAANAGLHSVTLNNLVMNGASPTRVNNDLTTFPFNVLPMKVDLEMQSADQKAALIGLKTSQNVDAAVVNPLLQVPAIAYESKDSLNDWSLNDPAKKSLLMSFNKTVHKYLHDCFDDSSMKIYTPLFESFMNSAASKEVVQNQGVNDVLDIGAQVPALVVPEGTILLQSIGLTMKALLNNMDMRLKKKKHVFESISEVPEYLKERMKVNLPMYSKLFNLVNDRSDLLRKLISNTGLKAVNNNTLLNGLLAHLCDLALSIKKCCDSVHKELQDTAPYFMDMSKDFILDYKQRYGNLPLMPASNVVLPQNARNRSLLLPDRLNGSYVYKFNMGSRMLLVRSDVEPQLDHIPCAKEIYNRYASVAQKNSMINPLEYANTIRHMIKLSRFLNDGVVYSQLNNNGSIYNKIDANNLNEPAREKCYQLNKTLVEVLNLAENSNRNESNVKFANNIDRSENKIPGNRKDLRVLNILDMNIVPINVHAFMREVPFVNVLNYSYTFDRMVNDFIIPNYTDGMLMKATDVAKSPRELLVKLLTHPYANLGSAQANQLQYNGLLASLFNGNDNLRLGRPRYLSDQLWHKVLLNSSAQLAAGQPSRNANLISLASGPAGYEVVRGVVNYGNAGLGPVDNGSIVFNTALSIEPVRTPGLKYWDGKKWAVGPTPAAPADVVHCAQIGQARFDTKLVRNLVWFVQLQRVMRVVLINHLSWLDTPVIKGLKIADPVVTEYDGNDAFDNADFDGSNYHAL